MPRHACAILLSCLLSAPSIDARTESAASSAQPAVQQDAPRNAQGGRFMARLNAADRDGDGRWTREEIAAVAPRLAERFASVDADGDGGVDAGELEDFVRERRERRRR